MKQNYYVTTPIYYVNGDPHVGTAYTTVAADVLARYNRLKGKEVFFLTGTDEHGMKIEEAATKQGLSAQELVDKMSPRFKNMWEVLNISYDEFIRTTEQRHKDSVKKIVKKVYDNGDIYKGDYEGLYCVSCETFVPKNQAIDEKYCPDCKKELTTVKESSYFFKLSKYQDRLIQYIEENPDFIKPSYRKNEVISFIKQGLQDLSISRNTFKWGIPLELDDSHVIYVWFDALTNYITAAGYENNPEMFEKFWNNGETTHLIGKDILRFHAIIWPAMLMSAEEKLPSKIVAHGWWTSEGEKMSKSKGNVINPEDEVKKYGRDAFRYFMMREVHFGADGDYSTRAIIQRINFDLANDLGNLLNRTLGMIDKYFGGAIEKGSDEADIFDEQVKTLFEDTLKEVDSAMDSVEFSKALEAIWKFISRMNKYIDETAPWTLAKDESKKERLKRVMYTLADSLYKIAFLVYPYMPESAEKMWVQLGVEGKIADSIISDVTKWQSIKSTKVGKAEPIFPRIEMVETPAPKVEEKKEEEYITIDEFKKSKIKVVEIMEAAPVEGADRLLQFKVKLGNEIKSVVSGIAKYYKPEETVGKKVLFVSNLQPVKLRGILSEGMLLTTVEKKRVKLIEISAEIPSGTSVE